MVFFGPQLVEKLFFAECSNASCRCYVSTELRERDSQRKKFAVAYPMAYVLHSTYRQHPSVRRKRKAARLGLPALLGEDMLTQIPSMI